MATTNIVERYFSMSDQESPQSTGEFLFKQVMNLSPIDQGSLGTYTIPLELAANYDFFRGTPIEPEFQEIVPGGKKLPRENVPVELRANRFTGSTARFLSESYGKKINLSPARIEFIVNKIFAGTGRDVMSLVDMPQSGWDKTGIANNQALGVQKMSRMPIIRTFLQTSAAGEKIMLYDIVSKIRKEKIVPREIQLELEAQSNWEMIQGMDAQGQKNEANALFQDMNDDMRNRIRRIKENTSTGKNNVMQIYEKLQGNRLKILYLIEVLNKIQTKSETNRMFREFNRLDLLSDEVKRNLRNAKTKGLLISNKPD